MRSRLTFGAGYAEFLYQAVTELVVANLHSNNQPIAVLTDLMGRWTLCWMEGYTVWYHTTSRQNAVEVLVETLQKFDAQGGGSMTALLEAARPGGDFGDQDAGSEPDAHAGPAPHEQEASKRQRTSGGSAGAPGSGGSAGVKGATLDTDALGGRGWVGPQMFQDECIDALVSLKDPEVPDKELDDAISLAVRNHLRGQFMCI